MSFEFQRRMHDAARLVRAGDLHAATGAIQQALRGHHAAAHRPSPQATSADGMVLDAQSRELPAADQPSSPGEHTPAAAGGEAGSFTAHRFGEGRGQREYWLYVPPQADREPLPLVVMLHGCTQDPRDFAAGTRMNEAARRQGCYVLYPAQSPQANPQRCWNWFKHSHQQRGRGEPALLAAMTRAVMASHAVDPARVYVAGLSAGGAMAAILGDAYPDLFAAVGVHSGLASGAARDLPSALAAMRSGAAPGSTASAVPTIVFHGDADTTVHPGNGGHVVDASPGRDDAQPQVERHRPAGARSYTRRVHRSAAGHEVAEHWLVHGAGHAWSGGSRQGSFTDPAGPDATAEMLRFFLQHRRG